jgi:transcriptional regulator with XRE-family HTH domain
MTDLPRVPRDKYRANQNVPIVGERLAAAIRLKGLSVRGVAELAGEKQQTIQRIAQGVTQRCRHARRRKLAGTLGVSEEWLGGANVAPFDGLPSGSVWTMDGRGAPIVADENFNRFVLEDAQLPPAYQLYWSDLTQRVVEAWQRDVEAGTEDARTLAELFPRDANSGGPEAASVSQLVRRGLGAFWWRRRLLLPIALPAAPDDLDQLSWEERTRLALENERDRVAQSPGVSTEDMDDFARLAAEACRVILDPWIEGKRALNYQAAFIVLRWLRSGMLLDVPPSGVGRDG